MPNKSLVYLGFVLMGLSGCTKGGPSYSKVGYNPIVPVTTEQLTISSVSTQTTNEDTATSAIALTIGGNSSLTCSALNLSVTSANTSLISSAGIAIGGTYPNCTLVFTPLANQFGTSLITVVLSTGSSSVQTTFNLNVTAIDDAPVAGGSSVTINQCASTITGSLSIVLPYSDAESDLATTCAVSAQSASLTGVAACTCSTGVCTMTGLKPTSAFVNAMTAGANSTISSAVTYTVTANGLTSASGTADFTVSTGTWTPNCLGSNLALWLDAQDSSTLFSDTAGTTAAVNNGSVAFWKDKTLRVPERGLNKAITTLPVLKNTGLNSFPAINLVSGNSLLGTNTYGITQDRALYGIVRLSSVTSGGGADASGTYLFDRDVSINSQPLFSAKVIGGLINLQVRDDFGAGLANFTSGTAASTGANYIIGFQRSSATLSSRVNGSAGGTSTFAGTNNQAQQPLALGHAATGMDGDVSYGEIILTSAALTAAEESRIEGYLASKWGSTALLPGGHTYKSSAP